MASSPTICSSSSSSIFSSSPSSTSHPSSITHLHSTHTTAGYRDGISLSKTPSSLQAGFDEGYSLGAVLGLRVGYIVGVFEALRYHQRDDGDDDDDDGQGEEEGGGVQGRGEKMWREAERMLRMDRVFGEDFFDRDGVWKFHLGQQQQRRRRRQWRQWQGLGEHQEQQDLGDDAVSAAGEKNEGEETEKEEGEEGRELITFFDVADSHPLIKEWMQKAKDEMERCGLDDPRSVEVEKSQ